MKSALIFPLTLAALLFATPAPVVLAQTTSSPFLMRAGGPADVEFSTSSTPTEAVPEAAPALVTSGYGRATGGVQPEGSGVRTNRPFRSLSLSANIGTSGIGFDVATPIAPRLKVRGGAQFYNQGFGFTTDGLHSNASLHLRNVALMLDVFPFHNGFHLSPGVTLNNGNRLADVVNVPRGQTFTLGDTNFTSSVTDPVSGSAAIQIGRQVAPRFTLGWEDVLRHKAGHFSVPVEFGFQYSGPPRVSLILSGTACYQQGCQPISSYAVSTATQQEILKIQNDLQPLRFYPITSTGIRYTFGR